MVRKSFSENVAFQVGFYRRIMISWIAERKGKDTHPEGSGLEETVRGLDHEGLILVLTL